MARQTSSKGMGLLKIALLLFFLLAVVLPLVGMFSRLADPQVREVFGTPAFASACVNSLVVAAITTVISVLAALLMSWVLCRTAIQGKSVFAVLLTVPMLVPSLAHGMSLVYLLGVERDTHEPAAWIVVHLWVSGHCDGVVSLLVPAGLSHDL